jgi:hypothetical protein
MSPTSETFDAGAIQWVTAAARVMLTRPEDIEAELGTRGKSSAFGASMRKWRDEFVNKTPFQSDEAASALKRILQEFALDKFIEKQSAGRGPRGAPRSRGAMCSASAPPDLGVMLAQVAARFAA